MLRMSPTASQSQSSTAEETGAGAVPSVRNESKRNAGTVGLALFIAGVVLTIVSTVFLMTGNASWLNVVTGALIGIGGFSSYSRGRKEKHEQERENDAREARERERERERETNTGLDTSGV